MRKSSTSSTFDVVIIALMVISIIVTFTVAFNSCGDKTTDPITTLAPTTTAPMTMVTITTKPIEKTMFDYFYDHYYFNTKQIPERTYCFDVESLPIEIHGGKIVDNYFIKSTSKDYFTGAILVQQDEDRDIEVPGDFSFPEAETDLGNLNYDDCWFVVKGYGYPIPWETEGTSLQDQILFRLQDLPVKSISVYIF